MTTKERVSDSPVYNAVNSVVGLLDFSNQAHIFSYKDKIHFQHLWSLLESDPPPEKIFIIVWDGIPESSTQVATSKYLTPIDWAVGFSLSVKKTFGDQKDKYPDIRIIILDVSSSSDNSDSVKFIKQFKNRDIKDMPWLRIITPIGADSGRALEDFLPAVLNTTDADKMLSMKDAYTSEKPDIDILRNIWAAFLTRPSTPGDRHALANLVGPLLLTQDDNADIHVMALSKLMRAIGLLPNNETDLELLTPDKPWIDWNQTYLNDLTTGDMRLNFILVDDMHERGWGQVLCMALGVAYGHGKNNIIGRKDNIVVTAHKTPDTLYEKIKNPSDKRFEFSIIGDNNAHEVVFLDLRLFSDKAIQDEALFFQDLVALAKQLNANTNLPWPGFSEEEIEQVEKWCDANNKNRRREDDAYITALTFLPRILALTDLSLPIIIFSSTGSRDIIQRLKPYGNIITAFDKPKFTVDIPCDIAEQTKRKFQDALNQAFKLLRGRKHCQKVFAIYKQHETAGLLQNTVGNIPDNIKHIEIYMDESGGQENSLSLGGLVMGYPEYETVFALSNALKDKGTYWYSNNPTDKHVLSKRPEQPNEDHQSNNGTNRGKTDWANGDVYSTFAALTKQHDVTVAAVRITDKVKNDSAKSRHYPLNEIASDERWYRTFLALLEIVVFELIPLWCKNNNNKITVSIFAPTRTPPIQFNNPIKNSETPDDYFGFGFAYYKAPAGQHFYTVSQSSVVALIAYLLKTRVLPSNIVVHHARAATLFYGVPGIDPETKKEINKQKWRGMRTQHYLADHVFHVQSVYQNAFKKGFNITADDDFYNLLDAQREIEDDNLPSAIKLGASCKKADDNITRHILDKLVVGIKKMKGTLFIQVCDDLNIDEVSSASSPPPETATEERTSVKITDIRYRPHNRLLEFFGNANQKTVKISANQVSKMGEDASRVKVGDSLIVTLGKIDGQRFGFFGRDPCRVMQQ